MIEIGLAQINSGFSGQHYFPYSVGILQAYAQRHLSNPHHYGFRLPIYRRISVDSAVQQLRGADIACFSTYVWNIHLSLAIARALKAVSPSTLVVFGGPQVPRRDRPWEVEQFLCQNRFVDLAVHGPGEEPLRTILERGLASSWETLPSVSFFNDGGLHQTAEGGEFKDLEDIPSPYVSGVFAPLMEENPEEKWIGLWETDRNCPFQCTFCGWGLLASKPAKWSLEHVYQDVDWFADHKVVFIFCANANFGLLPRDLEIASYVAKTKRERGYPQFLSVQDTKNAKDRALKVRKILREEGLNTGVVISLQSIDSKVLKAIKRDNIRLDDFRFVQQSFAAEGIPTMTDIILGLPEETYESFSRGVATLIEGGQHHRIQFNNLTMVPDAEMSHRDERARFGLETVRTKMVNIHGQIENEEVSEWQELVVGSASMPQEDWVRSRAFAWMVGLLHFDKILQIPLIVFHQLTGISYLDLFELFLGDTLPQEKFPVLAEIRTFFLNKARDIQQGGEEYIHSAEWLDIWWPADEYIFIKLVSEGRLGEFYAEAERALSRLAEERGLELAEGVLAEACALNAALVKRPFQSDDLSMKLSWNVWEVYRAVLLGQEVSLQKGRYLSRIDRTKERWNSWEEWYREVVWFGNKRGAYLYGNEPVEQIAGHF